MIESKGVKSGGEDKERVKKKKKMKRKKGKRKALYNNHYFLV